MCRCLFLLQQPELNIYLRTCKIGLDQKMEEIYHMFIVIAFYLVPMVIIAIFYLIISHHLWHVRVPGTMIRGKLPFFVGRHMVGNIVLTT